MKVLSMRSMRLSLLLVMMASCGESRSPEDTSDCRLEDTACPAGLSCYGNSVGQYVCAPTQDIQTEASTGQTGSAAAPLEPAQPTSSITDDMLSMTGGRVMASPQGPGPDADLDAENTEAAGSEMATRTPSTPSSIDPQAPTNEADASDDARDADGCERWPLDNDAPQMHLYEQLRNQYRPITVQNDLGGNPNRYTTARLYMFSEAERFDSGNGEMRVECVYTGTTASAPENRDPAREEMNCEHVMPRSRMVEEIADQALYEHQQSDMHNLMPSVPEVNSARGSFRFGTVSTNRRMYGGSSRGADAQGTTVFEVRPSRRGDIARMMFYFSTRWGVDIAQTEEATLRRWSNEDPVDSRERARNEAIARIQGNRNPFVDCPTLLEQIENFGTLPLDENALPFP